MKAKSAVVLICVVTFLAATPGDAWAQRPLPSDVEGEIEVLVVDHSDRWETQHFINVNGARRELRGVAGNTVHRTGDRVRIRGAAQLPGVLELSSNNSSIETIAHASLSTTGSQPVLVILVNFASDPRQPYTVEQAQAVMAQVHDHYWLGSYEQTTITADVAGWFTVAYDSTVCDVMTIATLADQAAANAGIDLSPYGHRVYAFPDVAACSWWGVGTVGGSPSSAWINGSFARKVVGHELGHNLGLNHAKAHECGAVSIGPTCSDLEYGNTIDIMGNPSSGNFNLFAKEQIGWVNAGASPPLTLVTESGAYGIAPYEAVDGRSKGLKILKSTDAAGVSTYYYVEFRQPIGNDAFLLNNVNVTSGVVVSMGSPGNNRLLDMTPETTSWSDPALLPGRRFVDPSTGLTIEATAVDPSGATVFVTLGTAVAPVASVSLNTASPRTNDVLTATATAFDANGDTVTLTYVWKVNGVTKKTTASTTSLTDSFNLGLSGNGDPGNTIAVDVTPFDGGLSGNTVSAVATVQRRKK